MTFDHRNIDRTNTGRQHVVLLLVLALCCGPTLASEQAAAVDADGRMIHPITEHVRGGSMLLIDYGSVLLGSSLILGVQITHVGEPGSPPITNYVVGDLQGDNPEAWELHSDGCTGSTQNPGEACVVFWRFTPTAIQSYAAEVIIESSASTSPLQVILIGRGIVDLIFSDRFQ